jgi:hypothetical protein
VTVERLLIPAARISDCVLRESDRSIVQATAMAVVAG